MLTSAGDVATTTAGIDPAFVALLSLTGVVLTIFAGLVGAWIQGRREHVRWVRERRFEAFLEMEAIINWIESARIADKARSPDGVGQEYVLEVRKALKIKG